MKFGLIAQMQVPKPWPADENVDHRIHWHTLDEAVLAEQVGFDYYWATEHHFYEEIAHSSAPEVFLAALAARTTRIRLGHGVVVLPCNHPVRVAERAATLDLLSNGRLDLGTGRGASWYHTEAFGVPIDQSREVWDEALRVICALFVNDTFPGHKGRHYDIPERKLVPKPLQKPHPPLWVAATSQATFASAARQGLGVLGFTAVPPEQLAPAVAAYRETQRAANPAEFFGATPNFQIAAFMTAHCDTDDRRGRAVAGAAARWYLGDNEAPLNRVRFGPDFDRTRFAKYTDDALIRDRMMVGGDPDTCSRVIESWAGVGVDQLILMVQAGLTSHDEVLRAIELLGTKVLPRFQDGP